MLGSRNGLNTAEDSMAVIATKIAELVAVEDELVTVERDEDDLAGSVHIGGL